MQAEIQNDGRILSLTAPGGTRARFHAIWLRDNARDPGTRDARNGQRLITLADLPRDPRITEINLNGAILSCRFDGEAPRDYDLDWLMANRYDLGRDTPRMPPDLTPWNATLSGALPTGEFGQLQEDPAALRDWLETAAAHGFAKATGMDATPGGLFKIVDLFGYVRETNYGRHFEVRSEINPTNLAYTGLGLQAHTDNPYRDPAPTLQILACLENSAEGGDSMVVDGFAATVRLEQENSDHFALLSRYAARFEYAGSAGVHLQARRPIIEVSPDGQLQQIRFNSRSIAPLTDIAFDDMPGYYAAYRHFSDIIDDPTMAATFKLSPGEAFLVDNTRVLHARRGFSGAGSRWLQGCYADRDGLLSTLASLTAKDSP